jgi:hypothetical protein
VFHSDQFTLYPGNTNTLLPNNSIDSTLTLPKTYTIPLYNLSVVLAGLSGTLDTKLYFGVSVSAYTSTSVDVRLITGDCLLYTLSVYVLVVNATSDWLWMVEGCIDSYNLAYGFVTLSNPNTIATHENFTANGPAVILNPGEFQAHAVLKGMQVVSDILLPSVDQVRVGLDITVNSVNTSDAIHLRTTKVGYTSYRSIYYLVILIHDVQIVPNLIMSTFYDYFVGTDNLMPSGTNMGIDQRYGNSTSGGYDGNCMIAIN